MSLHFLLIGEARLLHRWVDDARAELAKQPELGFNANDSHTGAAHPAPRPSQAAPPAPSAPPPRGKAFANMTPEERKAAGAKLMTGIKRAGPAPDTPASLISTERSITKGA